MRFRRKRDDIIEGEIIEDAEGVEASPAPARRGFFRRGRRQEDSPNAYRERVSPDVPTPDEVAITEFRRVADSPRQRWRLPRLLVWREVRPGLLVMALAMVFFGVIWTLANLNRTSETLELAGAGGLVLFALLWAVIALFGRQPASFLAAFALGGLGVSLLLDVQAVASWRETLVGVVLISIGLGIMARGLLLRQGSVA